MQWGRKQRTGLLNQHPFERKSSSFKAKGRQSHSTGFARDFGWIVAGTKPSGRTLDLYIYIYISRMTKNPSQHVTVGLAEARPKYQKLLEIEKECALREDARVLKNWRKINCWAQIITRRSRYGFWWFVLNNWFFFNFLTPAHPHAQSLFLFPIVFGINLIQFFDGKNKNRTGQDLIICLGFSITRHAARAIWKRGNKEGENIFGNGKCELIANFSATMVTSPWRERREVWREKRKWEFLARESVSSSPIVRIFGKGKCEFIANFSATMVTSLPSISLSLSLSLSPKLAKVPHAQYRKRFRASNDNSSNVSCQNAQLSKTQNTLSFILYAKPIAHEIAINCTWNTTAFSK